MACKVTYKSSVRKDLKNLDKTDARRILDDIEAKLAEDPDKGISLDTPYKGLFKYRIGNFRVIYSKMHDEILVLRIGHRKKVYK